jgi:hypothetical protein
LFNGTVFNGTVFNGKPQESDAEVRVELFWFSLVEPDPCIGSDLYAE